MKSGRQTIFLVSGLGFLLSAQSVTAKSLPLPKRCQTCVEVQVPVVVTQATQLHSTVAVPVTPSSSWQLEATLTLVTTAPAASASNQTFLVVNCPHEAEVRIDDFLTKSIGPSRLFRLISFDRTNLPRRVVITMTKYNDKYREEFEYTEIARCQPGKTTTVSIKMEDMHRKKFCEKDCPKSEDAEPLAAPISTSVSQDDNLLAELLTNASKPETKGLIDWELKRRALAVKLETQNKAKVKADAAEASLKNLKSRLSQMEDAYLAKLDEALAQWQKVSSLSTQDDTGIRWAIQSAIELEKGTRSLELQCSRLRNQIMESQSELDAANTRQFVANNEMRIAAGNTVEPDCRKPGSKVDPGFATTRKQDLETAANSRSTLIAQAKADAMTKQLASEKLAKERTQSKQAASPIAEPPKAAAPPPEPPKAKAPPDPPKEDEPPK